MDDLPRDKDGIANIQYLRDAARLMLLNIKFAEGQKEEARETLQTIIDQTTTPRIRNVMLMMQSSFLMDNDQTQEATRIIEDLLKEQGTPEQREKTLLLATRLILRKEKKTAENYQQAIEYMTEVLSLETPEITKCQAHRLLSGAYRQIGKYEEAITHAQKGIELSNKCGFTLEHARARLVLSMTHRKQKRYEEAKKDFQEIAQTLLTIGAIDDYAGALYGAVRCTVEQGKIEEATHEYEDAIKNATAQLPKGKTGMAIDLLYEYAILILRRNPERAQEIIKQGQEYAIETGQGRIVKKYTNLSKYINTPNKQQTKQ